MHTIKNAHAKKGALLIDMTTSSPQLAARLYEEAKTYGLHMLDAPVSGGDSGAINGTLSHRKDGIAILNAFTDT